MLAMYCKACALCEAGNYEAGIASFKSLGSYKDCAMRIIYYEARRSEMNGDSDEALKQAQSLYESIPLFLDSDTRAQNLYHMRIINYPDYISSFNYGLVVVTKDSKRNLVDMTNKTVIELDWDDCKILSEGLVAVKKMTNGVSLTKLEN